MSTAKTPDVRTVHQRWIAWLRFATGLRHADIAAEVGVSRAAISAWANANREPGVDEWRKLAALCGKLSDAEYWAGPSTELRAVVQVRAVAEVHG